MKHVVDLKTGKSRLDPLNAGDAAQRVADEARHTENIAVRAAQEKRAAVLRAAHDYADAKLLESLKDDPSAPQSVRDYLK